ncbi:MAG: hypothetical protein PHT62_06650 [Desulfotomaculaceae bacterium]|nr:hypothetical protein [Desulfotomaculaceae bacterium]
MTPRKKDRGIAPDTVTTPVEDENDLCSEASESACESCPKSSDDKNATC